MITPSHIAGAPDLLVEIASPGTVGYDRRAKRDVYVRAGVMEYCIADPTARPIEVLNLDQDSYRSLGVFLRQALLPSRSGRAARTRRTILRLTSTLSFAFASLPYAELWWSIRLRE